MDASPAAFGPFALDPRSGSLLRDGAPVPVGHRGLRLLAALLARPGEVLTKAELLDAAWPGLAVEEGNLTVQIAALRRQLGPGPGGTDWIATVPRIGYRFAGPLARAATAPEAPAIPTLAVLPFDNLGGDPAEQRQLDSVDHRQRGPTASSRTS